MKTKLVAAVIASMIAMPMAFAQDATTQADTPSNVEAANQTKKKLKRKRHGKKAHGPKNKHARYVRFANKLESLTPEQKTQIEEIQNELKTKSQPLKAQMKSLWQARKAQREAANAGGEGAGSTPANLEDSKAKAQEVRNSMIALKSQAWDKMKTVLSQEQLAELDKMAPQRNMRKNRSGKKAKKNRRVKKQIQENRTDSAPNSDAAASE